MAVRVRSVTVFVVAILALLSVDAVVLATTGLCKFQCTIKQRCYGSDLACYACDPVGGDGTCSDSLFIDYNPGSSVILGATTGGSQDYNSAQAVCYTSQLCEEGAWVTFAFCAGTGTTCAGSPLPTFCQVCVMAGTPYHEIVEDNECVSVGCGS